MQQFEHEQAADCRELERLIRAIDDIDPQHFYSLTFEQLSGEQTKVRKLRSLIENMTRKYSDSIAADDRRREQLRAERTAITVAEMSRPRDRHETRVRKILTGQVRD